MRPLTAQDILRVCEAGEGRHAIDKALVLLAVACPESTREEIAALSVGQRDALLLTLRESTFGAGLAGFAECPRCAERLEFSLSVTDILTSPVSDQEPGRLELASDGVVVRFRLPNSWDLAAIAGCEGDGEARRLLLERCVLDAVREGTPVAVGELPSEIVTLLASRMAESDPQANVSLDLGCPACGHPWQAIFDIVSFLWAEVAAQARHILREVHVLARAYGWREADVLAMSARRRQFYLDMVQ